MHYGTDYIVQTTVGPGTRGTKETECGVVGSRIYQDWFRKWRPRMKTDLLDGMISKDARCAAVGFYVRSVTSVSKGNGK